MEEAGSPGRQAPDAPDFAAEGLLDGVEDEARAARSELLAQLHAAGVPLDELRQAVREERLALLPAERVLAQEGRYTAAEVAERAGTDLELLQAQWRASGLPLPGPDDRVFGDEDVEVACSLKVFLDAGLPPERPLEAARVFGEAAARAAAAARTLVGQAFIRAGDTERDLGLRYAEAGRRLNPEVGVVLRHLYAAHLREQVRNDVVGRTELSSGRIAGTRRVAVCFADLVGFTRLGQRVAPDDLGTVAGHLSALAVGIAQPPVQLIKTIGDAAMLVSPEPAPLLRAALALVDAADGEGEDFPALRAGVAMGDALNRWGDWYGTPVNVAARVTAIARPASVLATAEVREAAEEDYSWSFAGRHRLKGVSGALPLFRCRPAHATAEA